MSEQERFIVLSWLWVIRNRSNEVQSCCALFTSFGWAFWHAYTVANFKLPQWGISWLGILSRMDLFHIGKALLAVGTKITAEGRACTSKTVCSFMVSVATLWTLALLGCVDETMRVYGRWTWKCALNLTHMLWHTYHLLQKTSTSQSLYS